MPNDQGQPESAAQPTVETPAPSEATPPPAPVVPENPTPAAAPVKPEPAGVEGYMQRKKQALETPAPSPADEQPAPAPGEPAPEPAAPEAPTPPEPAPTDPTPPEPAPDPSEPPKPGDFRPRLNKLPKVEQEAIALRREFADQGNDVPLAECIRRVEAKYGIEPSAPAAQPGTPATPVAVRTPEQIQTDLAAAEEARRTAIRALDPDAQFAAEDQIRQLNAEREQIVSAQETEKATKETAFAQELERNAALAESHYTRHLNASQKTAFDAEVDRIWADLEKTDNPIIYEANAPYKIAQMAGNKLGYAPNLSAAPAAPASQPSPSAASRPQPVKTQAVGSPTQPASPAPAAARTSQPGQPTSLKETIRTPFDYEQAKQKALAGSQ